MYRRPKFLEKLLEIRQEMADSTDYDVKLFAEMVRTGEMPEARLVTHVPEPRDIDAETDPDESPARRRTLVEK